MKFRFLSLLMIPLLGWNTAVAQSDGTKLWDLRECIDYALQHNLNYRQQENAVDIAELNYNQARTSRLPNLNGSTGFNSNFGRSVDPFTNSFVAQNFNSVNLGLQSQVTLFNGFQISNTIRQNELNLMAAEMDLDQQEMDVVLNVSLAYLTVLFNAELLESANLQVESTVEQRDRTARLVQAGTLAQADLIQLESQVATEELNRVSAQNQLELSYLSLMQLLTLDPSEKFGIVRPDVVDPDDILLPVSTTEIFQTALGIQPAVRAADIRVEAASKSIAIAKGGMYPRLTLGGTFNTGYSSVRQLPTDQIILGSPTPVVINGENSSVQFFSTGSEKYPFASQLFDQRSLGIQVGLVVPIYNQNQVRNNIAQREIQLKNAQINSEIARQTLRQSVEQAFTDAKTAFSTYKATKKQVAALELVYQNTEKQFNVGLVNSVDYLLSKNNFNRARFDLVRAKYSYLFRTKILDFYQGKPLGM